jgi:hypothetical protein
LKAEETQRVDWMSLSPVERRMREAVLPLEALARNLRKWKAVDLSVDNRTLQKEEDTVNDEMSSQNTLHRHHFHTVQEEVADRMILVAAAVHDGNHEVAGLRTWQRYRREDTKNRSHRMIQEYAVVVVDLPCKIQRIEDLREGLPLLTEDHRRFPPLDGRTQQKPWKMQLMESVDL